MFTNIEEKLKDLAVVNFLCGIIGGAVCVIVLFDDWGPWPILSITAGLLWLLVGLLSSWFIYAFAELLENTKETNKSLKELNRCLKTSYVKSDIVQKQQVKHSDAKASPHRQEKTEAQKRDEQQQKAAEAAKLSRISAYWDARPEEFAALAEKRAKAIEGLTVSGLTQSQREALQNIIAEIDEELNKDRES